MLRSVVPTEARGHVDTYSLVLPESMGKSMIHAATDSKGKEATFEVATTVDFQKRKQSRKESIEEVS